jgi:hypothetical protein
MKRKLDLQKTLLFANLGWIVLFIFQGSLFAREQPVEVVAGPAPLSPTEQKRVDEAIDRGVAFLRKTQLASGSWTVGARNQQKIQASIIPTHWPLGYAAFPGLALLECGVPAGDAAIQRVARYVRANISSATKTYEIAVAILFLDRLGEAEDRTVIRSLALRLAAGQSRLGGWGYNCPVLTPDQEKKVLEALAQQKEKHGREVPVAKSKKPEKKGVLVDPNTDNSNSQFAILALWIARKHKLPLDSTLARSEQRFRLSLKTNGWGYIPGGRSSGAMTCVGLLGLAVGRGSAPEEKKMEGQLHKLQDEGITSGLRALAIYMNNPTNDGSGINKYGPPGALNYYFLWSVERVGVLCKLETIGGKDWYRWGSQLLVPAQRLDGSWLGRGNGGSPVIDTSMALLFLRRSDLLPDLRETLQKRLKITDPGLDKVISPKKSPGEKSHPKSGTKSPGEKSDGSERNPDLQKGIEKRERDDQRGKQSKAKPPADAFLGHLPRARHQAVLSSGSYPDKYPLAVQPQADQPPAPAPFSSRGRGLAQREPAISRIIDTQGCKLDTLGCHSSVEFQRSLP